MKIWEREEGCLLFVKFGEKLEAEDRRNWGIIGISIDAVDFLEEPVLTACHFPGILEKTEEI